MGTIIGTICGPKRTAQLPSQRALLAAQFTKLDMILTVMAKFFHVFAPKSSARKISSSLGLIWTTCLSKRLQQVHQVARATLVITCRAAHSQRGKRSRPNLSGNLLPCKRVRLTLTTRPRRCCSSRPPTWARRLQHPTLRPVLPLDREALLR